jgi:hypothetical protein
VNFTLADEPTEYEVEVGQGAREGVTTALQKAQPEGERMKAELLADEIVVKSTT